MRGEVRLSSQYFCKGLLMKYPRIPHLPGSNATDDDDERSRSYPEGRFIIQEKLDGTNAAIVKDQGRGRS